MLFFDAILDFIISCGLENTLGLTCMLVPLWNKNTERVLLRALPLLYLATKAQTTGKLGWPREVGLKSYAFTGPVPLSSVGNSV